MGTVTYMALDAIRVAMVDDSPYFRRLLRSMLKGMGVGEILEATTINAGWEIASRQTPDILLVDWNLDGDDGLRLLDRIRTSANDVIATQLVVFLSAHTDKRHVLTAARRGANDFIVKPVSPRMLYERLSRLVRTRTVYRRLGDRLVPESSMALPRRGGGPERAAAAAPVPEAADPKLHFL